MRAMEILEFNSPLRMREKDLRPLADGYARVRMKSNGICATDVKMVDGRGFKPPLPFVPGHEPAGIIDEVNSMHDSNLGKVGKPVVIHPHVACGVCENCIAGNENVCLNMQASYGINRNGGLQEYVDVPLKNLIELPKDMPLDMGALAGGVIAVPLRGIKQLGTILGKKVMIFGTGGLAFSAIQIAKSMGAEVIVVGRKPEKLEVAAKIGADHTVLAGDKEFLEPVKEISRGGVHFAIDLAGDNMEVPKLLQTLRRNGKLLIIGYSAKNIEIPYNRLALDGISVIGTRSYTRQDLAESVDLILKKKCTPIISKTFPLEETNEALNQVRSGESIGRVLVHPDE